jgi:NAD(P)-dependent dehydrogenase (short-subunit alcohol dehydrogenase family)
MQAMILDRRKALVTSVARGIGRAEAFLCSDDADYMTETSLLVDGGYALRATLPAPDPGENKS